MTTRRRFLAAAAAAAGAAGLAAGFLRGHRPREAGAPDAPPAGFPNRLRLPGAAGMLAVADATQPLAIVARRLSYPLLPGRPVPMLAYEIEQRGERLINPVLYTRTGSTFRARFWNALDEASIVHWHGLRVDSNNDGHPHYAVPGGATYDYHFTVANRAGTYWYHPHPHHAAARQTWLGLAGLIIVEDDEESALREALDLAFGETDLPLLIQDRRFTADGALHYAPDEAGRFHGHLGDTVLVNYTPAPHFEAASRLYRLRVVNGSNARLYRLAFAAGAAILEFTVVGNDGGLLERPVAARELFLSPAERADVLLDLRDARPGDAVTLKSLPFEAMDRTVTGVPAHAPAPPPGVCTSTRAPQTADGRPVPEAAPNGAPLDLLRIRVARRVAYERALPRALSRIEALSTSGAPQRHFALDHARGEWRINGATYRMTQTAFTVRRGATEVWTFHNPASGMPHPIHVHGFPFRMIERSGSPPHAAGAGPRGLHAAESGWKDTALLWPGETLAFAIDFSHDYPGDQVYLLQCHNLEHEDRGMMLNFRIAY
jgi:suppressor of ftsI/bilirubin oxidase